MNGWVLTTVLVPGAPSGTTANGGAGGGPALPAHGGRSRSSLLVGSTSNGPNPKDAIERCVLSQRFLCN